MSSIHLRAICICGHLAVLFVSLFLPASAKPIYHMQIQTPQLCAKYQRSTCLVHSNITGLLNANCHSKWYKKDPTQGPCNFNVTSAWSDCIFAESGYFETSSGPCLNDPFMSTDASPPAPCSERCCDGSDSSGEWLEELEPSLNLSRNYNFVAKGTRGCKYQQFTRGQVLDYLYSLDGAPLVLVGDR